MPLDTTDYSDVRKKMIDELLAMKDFAGSGNEKRLIVALKFINEHVIIRTEELNHYQPTINGGMVVLGKNIDSNKIDTMFMCDLCQKDEPYIDTDGSIQDFINHIEDHHAELIQ